MAVLTLLPCDGCGQLASAEHIARRPDIGNSTTGKSSEKVHADFQKRGLVLASLLECPVEPGTDANEARALREHHLPHALARIRRSLKPKRVLVVSAEL